MLNPHRFRSISLFLISAFPCFMAPWAQTGTIKVLPVTYHDFNASHADFQDPKCFGGKNMVQDTLGPDRKPVHLPGNLCSTNSLPDWFHDAKDNTRYCKSLTLDPKPGTASTYEYSNPFFFPLDSVPTNEKIYTGDDHKIHNFHFCMEMHASFKYQGGEVFDFLGDDDVWVYVNNRLALDLGGLHEAQKGLVDLDLQQEQLKISIGNYYNFDFFFCERQTTGSDLKVTTNIDILPPAPSGLHITDFKQNILGGGDTLTLPKGAGSATFNSIKTSTRSQMLDCADVLTQVQEPVSGNWTLGPLPLPVGPSAKVDPDAVAAGLYRLTFEKDGGKDSLWIRITELPAAGTPTANPPGGSYPGTIQVTLDSPTPGAAIHYTLDGSEPTPASPVYKGPIAVLGTVVLKAMAVKAGYRNSAILIEAYASVLARAAGGFFLDRDGDGRIETAVVRFDSNFRTRPKEIRFTDPFNRAIAAPPVSAETGARSMTYSLSPFTPGTGFPADSLAAILAEPGVFGAQKAAMEDSVGPVLKYAVSVPSANPAMLPTLDVEFSEPVAMDAVGKAFPFDLKRNGAPVDAGAIRIVSMQPLSPIAYRFTFPADSKYPVPSDSLRITKGAPLADLRANPSRMAFFVPVGGSPARTAADLVIGLEKGVTSGPDFPKRPNPNPVVVHGQKTCANCEDAGVRELLPTRDPALISSLGPTWNVKTKYPFRYSLFFYDNLGQFVNKAEGDVDPSRFEALRAEGTVGDSVIVSLTFLPVSRTGNGIASGAYIMKGVLRIRDQPGLKGPQGEQVMLAPTERTIVSRFGYLRKVR
jgi:fibro-slime domain-containing protein